MRPKLTLAFDTSAAHCAAALLYTPEGAPEQVYARYEPMAKGQAERLITLLDELLAEAKVTWADLDVLAVGIGPGNFTGVRISVAAARGLGLALNIPTLGVTSLEAMAYGLPRPVQVVEDARRDMIYCQTFGTDDAQSSAPQLCAISELAPASCPRTGSAAGDAALPAAMPLAVAIAKIAHQRAQSGLDHPRPAPFYMRAADAAPPADPPPRILDLGADHD